MNKDATQNLTYKDKRALKEKERMKKPLKTAIHPTRIIAYLVQLGIAIAFYYFLRNHFMMLVLYLIGAALFLDVLGLFFLYRGIDVELSAPETGPLVFSFLSM